MRPVHFSFDAWEILVSSVLGLSLALTLVGVGLLVNELVCHKRAGLRNFRWHLLSFVHSLGGIVSPWVMAVVMLWSGKFDEDNAVPGSSMLVVAGVSAVWGWWIFFSARATKSS